MTSQNDKITARKSSSKRAPQKRRWVAALVKVLVCTGIIAPILYLLSQHLAEMDKAQIAQALHSIPMQSIAIAGLFTFFSLIAVAHYDVLAIRQLGLNVPKKLAVRGGFVAVSIGQTLGFGLIVGAIARWRFYRSQGVGVKDAGLISGIVTIGFLNGFIVVLSLCVLLAPEGVVTLTGATDGAIRATALLALAIATALVLFSIAHPSISVLGYKLDLPKLRVLRAQVVLAALDTIPAAIALWVLIPADIAPSLLHVIPVYLAALGLGLISNSPGGLGVLELTCLMALPVVPAEQLVAALIAYRGIYFGVPALLAIAMLMAREVHGSGKVMEDCISKSDETSDMEAVECILSQSERAEAHLAVLGDKNFIISEDKSAFLMYGGRGNSLVALGDPVGNRAAWEELCGKFDDLAARQMRTPLFYKIGQEFAEYQSKNNRQITHISSEAVVDVASYATSGSSKRELRRKLKSSEKSGLQIVRHKAGEAPLLRYKTVSDMWSASKGGERGFSMGYFKPDYIARFASLEARLNGHTIGFVTLWISGDGREQSLDVMRLLDYVPDGTMHALVHAAILWSKEEGASRFSLCAVPMKLSKTPETWVEQSLSYVYERKAKYHGNQGLFRFKNAFRPNWEPRFGASKGTVAGILASVDALALINETQHSPEAPDAPQGLEFEAMKAA